MQRARNEGAHFSVLPDGSRHENDTAPSIILPSEVFQRFAVPEEVDLIIGIFDSSLPFKRANQANTNFAVASSIITAAVSGHDVSDLESDVIITLPLLSEVLNN